MMRLVSKVRARPDMAEGAVGIFMLFALLWVVGLVGEGLEWWGQ